MIFDDTLCLYISLYTLFENCWKRNRYRFISASPWIWIHHWLSEIVEIISPPPIPIIAYELLYFWNPHSIVSKPSNWWLDRTEKWPVRTFSTGKRTIHGHAMDWYSFLRMPVSISVRDIIHQYTRLRSGNIRFNRMSLRRKRKNHSAGT